MLLIVLLAGGAAWVLAFVFVMPLVKAAKTADEAMQSQALAVGEPATTFTHEVSHAATTAFAPGLAYDELGVDLAAHPRPTRRRTLTGGDGAPRPAATTPTVSLAEAADTLGVEPDVVLAWEARYGYPTSIKTPGSELVTYLQTDVIALASALQSGLSIAGAITTAITVTTRHTKAPHQSTHRQSRGAA